VLFREESAPCNNHCDAPVWWRPGLLWKVGSARPTEPLSPSGPREVLVCASCGVVSRRVHSHYQRRVTDLPLLGRIVQLMVIAAASAATPSCAGGKSSPNASLTVFWLPRRDARTFNEGLENATNTVGFIPGGGNGRLWREADLREKLMSAAVSGSCSKQSNGLSAQMVDLLKTVDRCGNAFHSRLQLQGQKLRVVA